MYINNPAILLYVLNDELNGTISSDIDIQIVKYLDMYNILDPKLKKIIDKYKKIYLDDSISGITRNKCNSSIINDLILDNRKKEENV